MNEQQLDPFLVSKRIRQDYERYIESAFPMKNAALREQFRELLQRPDFLVRGPFIEATPPFRCGQSVREMATNGELCQNILELDGPGFPDYGYPIDRRLYRHQEQAITKVHKGRNVVVATGTGSGKTESFLLPIIDHLLRERELGTLGRPGVRALLLYPMNALANDQLKRLRRLLQFLPEITFGRYTGQTQEHQDSAEQDFRHVFPNEPRIENELLSRDQIREHPPHILLTNYAMLEYLLLRPKDTPLFGGEFGGFWAYIVVDEAHSYSGAAGMEVGMLLRRLKDRVVKSRPGELRCVATSATLGKGRADFPHLAEFARALFGEMFEWDEHDEERQDIVEPSIQDHSYFSKPWGRPKTELYDALRVHVADMGAMEAIARKHGVPDDVVDQAVVESHDFSDCFLYRILCGDARVRALKEILGVKPLSLEAAARTEGVFGNEGAECLLALVNLISLCVKAKHDADSAPLISARYHLFCRALEGAFVTFPTSEAPLLHLEPLDRTEERGIPCQAFEMATCRRCGHMVLAGTVEADPLGDDGIAKTGLYLRPPQPNENERPGRKSFFSWDVLPESSIDEDESVLASAETAPLVSKPANLCTACGALTQGNNEPGCNCDPKRHIEIYEAPLRQGRLGTCPACGAQTPYQDIVHRFYTGQDAPVAVLASSLYQHVPPESTSNRPGGSRKLLTFSDSRQDAAYFAPYLETTHQNLLQRRLLVMALNLYSERFGQEPARPLGLADTLLLELSRKLKIFPSPGDAALEQKVRCSWVFQELLALDRRLGLEGTALLKVGYTRPSEWRPPDSLMQQPWSLSEDAAWSLVEVLLDTLRFSGCVCVEPADITSPEFEPRNRLVYCRESGGNEARGMTILGWVPQRDIRTHVTNRRFDYLCRILAKQKRELQESDEALVMKALREVWRSLTDTPILKPVILNDQRLGVAYHVNPNFVEMRLGTAGKTEWRHCSACRAVSGVTVNGVCPTMRCLGSMLNFEPESDLSNHHYRRLYLEMAPVPMMVCEHTAQWGARKAAEIQQLFMDGAVNVLSCSTTFELGVDVGDLQAVLMRNVPPKTANYVQRAGRAGRRTGAVALALTFAQRRPHDMTHFMRPEEFISGKIKAPAVEIHNPKIVRRHVHSVTLAEFFRRHPETFENVEKFFCQEINGKTGPVELELMLLAKPSDLLESLLAIVPPDRDVLSELRLKEWGWVAELIKVGEDRILGGVLGQAAVEVQTDLAEYERLEGEAVTARRYQKASAFKRQANNIRRRQLLGFLASRNVLPKYGFPVDVVELRLKPSSDVGQEVKLERDLKVAISEYAPGGQVVAGHRVWTSTGIRRLPDRNPLEFGYAVCPHCGRFHKSIQYESLPMTCNACGDVMRGRGLRAGLLVVPQFGFFSNKDPERVGRSRPQRLYSSRVFFSEHASVVTDSDFRSYPQGGLENGQPLLSYRFSRQGELVVVNSGIANRGFLICRSCGYAEPAPLRPRQRNRNHQNAFDKPCNGILEQRHLGHQFLSDVLEIRFLAKQPYDPERSVWWSLLYALLQGASEALGIERGDIDGCLYPYGESYLPPAVVLFDSIPGGAGHVRRIGDNLDAVLKEALVVTNQCQSCEKDTACYACLKAYDNQFCHHLLRRGSVAKYLEEAGIGTP